MTDLARWSIRDLRDALKRREIVPSEIAGACLDRIRRLDPDLKSFLSVDEEGLSRSAAELDRRMAARTLKLGFLTGIPIGVKDNIVTKGWPTSCASRILEGWIPPYDATVVRRLRSDGALIAGKTNCDEFAMGSSTENSAFFPTRNPWNLALVPGGSSGGSAAAVAAGLVPGALGSDTGGSIRQPAAFCGVVGLKPTYGRVSRYGLVAFGSSLDQVGPLARTVKDAAAILQVTAGRDPQDSTSSTHPIENFVAETGKDIRGLRIGVPQEWFGTGLDPDVERLVRAAIARLEGLGCNLEEVRLPHTEYAIAVYYIVAPAEASSNLSRYDGVRFGFRASGPKDLQDLYLRTRTEGFGSEVKRRIMIGTYVLSSGYYDAYFLQAARVRTLIRKDYEEAFRKVDLLAGPTTPTLPFGIGEKSGDPMAMYLSDVYTVTANLAGIPALSLPCGLSPSGLPVGLQLLGPAFSEGVLLRAAHALESELALVQQDRLRPPV
jgi:aspartyl-tRNA(Asn)/glutamyl-tRNA(Gln) amidotransferase subunit A